MRVNKMKYVYVILVFLLCGCSRSFRSDSESCKVSVDVDFSVVEECLSLADIVSAKQIIPLSLPKGEVIGRPVQDRKSTRLNSSH